MPAFDLDLTDPTPAVLEKAMGDAVESANLRCRVGVMPLDRGSHRRFLSDEFAARPEGVAIWWADKGRVETFPPTPRATLLGVVWRTTPGGQRMVRVVGRRIEPFQEHPSHRFGPPWRSWPALCLLDPDHAVMRTLPGCEAETIALCDCGAVGRPEKLGWMASRCGPCHDHFEDHGKPVGQSDGPLTLRTAGQLLRVGFLPSGQALAALEWIGQGEALKVAIWDRQTGKCQSEQVLSSTERLMTPVEIKEGLILQGLYSFYWIGNNPPARRRLSRPNNGVAYAVEGSQITAVCYDGEGLRRDLTAGEDWQQGWPQRRNGRDEIYAAIALAPDGSRVALGRTGGVVELFDRAGGEGLTLQPRDMDEEGRHQRVRTLAFSPDGKLLAAGAGRSGFVEDPREEWWGRNGGIYLYDTATGKLLTSFPTPKDDIMAVAFSPDGSFLFCGSTDCTIRVVDLASPAESVVLSGHVGGVNALAFSPDGETLASAGGDGLVRFWPWRRLLARP